MTMMESTLLALSKTSRASLSIFSVTSMLACRDPASAPSSNSRFTNISSYCRPRVLLSATPNTMVFPIGLSLNCGSIQDRTFTEVHAVNRLRIEPVRRMPIIRLFMKNSFSG